MYIRSDETRHLFASEVGPSWLSSKSYIEQATDETYKTKSALRIYDDHFVEKLLGQRWRDEVLVVVPGEQPFAILWIKMSISFEPLNTT